MPVEASNNSNACSSCGSTPGEGGTSLFLGYFESLEAVSIAHPAPEGGSRALITVAAGADIPAYWDEGDAVWRSYDQNNITLTRQFNIPGTGPITATEVANFCSSASLFTMEVLPTHSPVWLIATRTEAGVTKKYYFDFKAGKGKWGNEVIVGNSEIFVAHLMPFGTGNASIDDVESAANTVAFDLGELPDGDWLTAANSEGRDLSDDTKVYYIKYTQGDDTFLRYFEGENGFYGGAYVDQFVADDFSPAGDSTVSPDTPTLQEVTDEENFTTNDLVVHGDEGKTAHTNDGHIYTSPTGTTIKSESPHNPTHNVVYMDPVKPTDQVRAMISDIQKVVLYPNEFKYPADFNFQPFRIYGSFGGYTPSISNKSLVASKIPLMKPYYVGFAGASDSNNGETQSTSVATISYAIDTLGARLIYLAEGFYSEGFWGDINNATGDDVIIIGAGSGRTIVTAASTSSHVWSLVTGTTYSTTQSNANRVVDMSYNNAFGFPTSLSKADDQTDCENTPNSYYITGSTVYVNLIDGRVPDGEVEVMKRIYPSTYRANSGYLYIQGITFMGGNNAHRLERISGDNSLIALYNDVDFLYGGGLGLGTTGNGEGLRTSIINLTWLENCRAYGCDRDGINYNGNLSIGSTHSLIEVNVNSFRNGGLDGTNFINGSTAHSMHYALRINGSYHDNYGPNIIDVNGASQSLNLGCRVYNSLGADVTFGTFPGNADFACGETAGTGTNHKMYVVDCRSFGSINSFAINPDYAPGNIIVDSATYYDGNASFPGVVFQDYPTSEENTPFEWPALSTGYEESVLVQSVTGDDVDNTDPKNPVIVSMIRNIITDSADSSSVTGTTSETILKSYLIPANTLDYGVISLRALFQKTGTSGTAQFVFRVHTSNAVGGTIIATSGASSATDLTKVLSRDFYLKSGNTLVGYPFSSGVSLPAQSSVAPGSVSFDPTIDNYIILTVTPANAGDAFKSVGFELLLKKNT